MDSIASLTGDEFLQTWGPLMLLDLLVTARLLTGASGGTALRKQMSETHSKKASIKPIRHYTLVLFIKLVPVPYCEPRHPSNGSAGNSKWKKYLSWNMCQNWYWAVYILQCEEARWCVLWLQTHVTMNGPKTIRYIYTVYIMLQGIRSQSNITQLVLEK